MNARQESKDLIYIVYGAIIPQDDATDESKDSLLERLGIKYTVDLSKAPVIKGTNYSIKQYNGNDIEFSIILKQDSYNLRVGPHIICNTPPSEKEVEQFKMWLSEKFGGKYQYSVHMQYAEE